MSKTTHIAARLAAVVVGLEGIAVLVLTAVQAIELFSGDADDPSSGIALIVLTAVGGIALIAFAGAILRDQSWGRSGGIVSQLLVLAVALGAVTGAYADPIVALALAAPAVVALILLLVAVRRAGAERAEREARGE